VDSYRKWSVKAQAGSPVDGSVSPPRTLFNVAVQPAPEVEPVAAPSGLATSAAAAKAAQTAAAQSTSGGGRYAVGSS
jgi:hypothetical protein